ncbi:hypothetical protein [Nitrosomonas aestuarii]|nr:hypothetical protein [Nitrosomonas aestuarii]
MTVQNEALWTAGLKLEGVRYTDGIAPGEVGETWKGLCYLGLWR